MDRIQIVVGAPQAVAQGAIGTKIPGSGVRHWRVVLLSRASVPSPHRAKAGRAASLRWKTFLLRPDAGHYPDHFRDWYRSTGSPWFVDRVEFLARRTRERPSRVDVRDLGFRWGSCGKNSVLLFNWKILQLPVQLVDYVIAHELTHLEERKHTPNFWRSLERAMPDWRERKETLAVRAKDFMVFGIAPETF